MDVLRRTVDPVIFLEKVRRPALRGLVRDRLERRLADVTGPDRECSCVLVLAPPGSGKTTLLSHLADSSPHPVAWYRAGPEDCDEIDLTRHLGYALGSALNEPSIAEAARSGHLEDLLRRLDQRDVGAALLVVDDLHEITGTSAEAALEAFLRLRPRVITTAIGSRRQPQLNTSRLLVSGELIAVDGEDLRFRSWEVEQLFRSIYQTPLSPEAAAALTRRTGGWAAGLQLFHLATNHLGRAERESAVTELSGRSRLIRSYLARNVLAGLPDDRRRFLLHTAALGVLTGDLCDALLQTVGSAAVLAELEREQFFTTSTDAGRTYHYHQVLQTHLEVLLFDELGSRAARQLYARSGHLLEEAGRPAEAVRAHAHAEDWGAVARLLRPDAAMVSGDDTLWRMLSLPGAPTDDPGLVLAGARRLARDGQVEAALAAYQQAERLLDDPMFRRKCAAERQAVAVWRPQSPRSALAPSPPVSDPESVLLRRSLELRRLTRDVRHPQTCATGWRRVLAYLLAGDLPAAENEFAELGPLAEGAESIESEAGGPAWESVAAELVGCAVHAMRSPDDDLAGRIETLTLNAEVDGWPWLARLGRSLQTTVQLQGGPERWRVEAAADLLSALARGADRWSQLIAAAGVAFAAARIGEHQLADRARQQTSQLAEALGAPTVPAAVELLLAAEPVGPQPVPELPREPAAVQNPTGSAAVAEVELQLLGGFRLLAAGREVGWLSLRPRARRLLMLLALNHDRPLHRELIIEALWPDANLASGIRSLQVAVSSVRQCLAAGGIPGALARMGDAYELVLPDLRCDVADFERAVVAARRRARLDAQRAGSAAVDLYRGDLLPEVGPADWVVEERDRLRLLAATVAAETAAAAADAGDPAAGVELARRSVELDACHDSAWRLLIRGYELLGDLSAAAVARRCHQRVWDDLGVRLGG